MVGPPVTQRQGCHSHHFTVLCWGFWPVIPTKEKEDHPNSKGGSEIALIQRCPQKWTGRSRREFGKVTEHRSIQRSQLHFSGLAKLKSEKSILFTMASKEQKPVRCSVEMKHQGNNGTPLHLSSVLEEVTPGCERNASTLETEKRPRSPCSTALRDFLQMTPAQPARLH